MAPQALEGLRVIDLTQCIAGPYCTKLLADFGADVIKVERPEGDPARRMPPFLGDEAHPEKSGLFLYLNTNKRGITLDLRTQAGRDILKKLVPTADMLVENFEPRVLKGWRLGYRRLERINPRLVMVSVSNFGQTGPYRDYKAQDIVSYAMGGLMYDTGRYDEPPTRHGLDMAQMMAGANAAACALMALWHAQETGQGQQVDTSIQETVIGTQVFGQLLYPMMGAVPRRQPKGGGGTTTIIAARDGYVVPLLGHVDWEVFAAYMGRDDLLDPKFADLAQRPLHGPELAQIMSEVFATRDKHTAFQEGQELRFPWAVVETPEDVAHSPQLAARDFFAEVDRALTGPQRYPGAPFKMTATPWQVRRPAPLLGEHTAEVLGELGYSKADVQALAAAGVV
ncbi:MAG: CoA transferase [Chloroflexi bacterium]|nr:CoA transferase [Chloroflexota bacterium]